MTNKKVFFLKKNRRATIRDFKKSDFLNSNTCFYLRLYGRCIAIQVIVHSTRSNRKMPSSCILSSKMFRSQKLDRWIDILQNFQQLASGIRRPIFFLSPLFCKFIKRAYLEPTCYVGPTCLVVLEVVGGGDPYMGTAVFFNSIFMFGGIQ